MILPRFLPEKSCSSRTCPNGNPYRNPHGHSHGNVSLHLYGDLLADSHALQSGNAQCSAFMPRSECDRGSWSGLISKSRSKLGPKLVPRLGTGRAQASRREPGFQRERGGVGVVLLVLILLAALVVGGAMMWYQNWQQTPVYVGENPLHFEVKKGASMRRIAEQLADRGDLSHPRVLAWFAQQQGLAQKIQAGEYAIASGATPSDVLQLFVTGDVVNYPLTIIEGWTAAQMMDAINAHDAIKHTVSTIDEAMDALGFAGQHPEGRFYPDTYLITKGQSDIEVLRIAYATMADVLDEVWQQKQEDIPLKTPYEALILASIVERETGAPQERAQIAGVFTRRLNLGMRLQTDPTVIYGIGDSYAGDITRAHLSTDTPYNTYTRNGLTPTPISLPGKDSLLAAVNPAKGSSLYFVATGKGDGRHTFSDNLEDHNRAVRVYLKNLKRSN